MEPDEPGFASQSCYLPRGALLSESLNLGSPKALFRKERHLTGLLSLLGEVISVKSIADWPIPEAQFTFLLFLLLSPFPLNPSSSLHKAKHMPENSLFLN